MPVRGRIGGKEVNVSVRLSAGRADPFGLLVLAVMLALLVTIGIQSAAADDPGPHARSAACPAVECLSTNNGR
jgi:hypothetical protein